MVSQRRGRGIFVVSNPMPHKLRQERHMPLRWSLEIWFGSNYKYSAPPVLPRGSQRLLVAVLVCGGDEAFEQRMRLVRLALKFRMELARHKKRMVLQFDDLDELAIG